MSSLKFSVRGCWFTTAVPVSENQLVFFCKLLIQLPLTVSLKCVSYLPVDMPD
ncbi:Uncharacterised protein [Citrobacter koseri]|nr:Uncharacterised protein [Citrobacter koseri]